MREYEPGQRERTSKMNLMELAKLDRPGVNLDIASMIGPRGLNDASNSQGILQAIQRLYQVTGLNTIIQVNDCETSGDWAESDNGTFDYAVGATGKRVGTNCLKLTSTAAGDGTQYVETLLVNESAAVPKGLNAKKEMDWTDTDYIGFWKHAASSAHFGTAGELKFALINDGKVNPVSGTEGSAASVTGTAGTEHHWVQIDISGYDRDKVSAIRFYCNNANTSEDCYIDDIIRYKYQFNGGPMYGCGFPIKSATALSENHWAQWTIDGLIASVTAANIADVGPVLLNSSTATGTAARSVWALLPGRFIFLIQANAATVAGEGLEWAANGLAAGVSTGVEEKCWAKGLEAAGAQYDHIFAMFDTGGRFIS